MASPPPPTNGPPAMSAQQRPIQPNSMEAPFDLIPTTEDANNEDFDVNSISEVSTGEKRKREGKQRSQAWQHFTKLIKEDGTHEKCKCNHCHKLFTYTNKSGTTHLLRHILEGYCPVYKKENKDKTQLSSDHTKGILKPKSGVMPWQFYQGLSQVDSQPSTDEQDDLLPIGFDYLDNQTCPVAEEASGSRESKLPQKRAPRRPDLESQSREESWINELKGCVSKLVELTNGKLSKHCFIKPCSATAPDYSIAAAVKCLNEMEDIPESSEMYVDAFEIIKDPGERECFICLNPEPRRRWLQRMLHRRYPSRYNYNIS